VKFAAGNLPEAGNICDFKLHISTIIYLAVQVQFPMEIKLVHAEFPFGLEGLSSEEIT
jgi:hypothetical protein